MADDDFSIERELVSGERLLWRGRPKAGVKFDPDDIVGIFFFLVWTGIACFAEYLAFTQKFAGGPANNDFTAVVFAPFLAFGLYKIVASVIDTLKLRTMEYALTDRRAMFISGPNPADAISINTETARIMLTEQSDGS